MIMPHTKRFADLHCHTTIRVFHHFSRKNRNIFFTEEAHPWTIAPSKKRTQKKGLRAKRYSQSDFDKLTQGNVKLVFATIYPFEQGYTYYDKENRFRASLVASIVIGINISRLNYLEHPRYNYWEEFLKEHVFLCRRSGIPSISQPIRGTDPDDEPDYDDEEEDSKDEYENHKGSKGTYWVVADKPESAAHKIRHEDASYQGNQNYHFKDFEGAKEVLEGDSEEIIVVLNVEGSHFLSLNKDSRLPNAKVSETELFSRIAYLKTLDPPVFYITPAHHFDNLMISHAKSIPEMNDVLPEQRKNVFIKVIRHLLKGLEIKPSQSGNMNFITKQAALKKGIAELGYRVLLELLHLDEQENGELATVKTSGRRILIDTKHMSAAARKDFYTRIVLKFNKEKTLENRIPILASHSAYAGRYTLEEMIANYDNEDNSNTLEEGKPTYLDWNINLCDEDVSVICHSGGLIGLNFEQRIVGVPYNAIRDDFGLGRKKFEKDIQWEKILAQQVKAMAMAAASEQMHKFDLQQFSIWDVICIGSDFDGGIDPVNSYPTAVEFDKFKKDLVHEITYGWTNAERQKLGLTSAKNIELAVQKICFDNLHQFWLRNFKKNYFEVDLEV